MAGGGARKRGIALADPVPGETMAVPRNHPMRRPATLLLSLALALGAAETVDPSRLAKTQELMAAQNQRGLLKAQMIAGCEAGLAGARDGMPAALVTARDTGLAEVLARIDRELHLDGIITAPAPAMP